MTPPSSAVHRTILVVDVAGFGDTSRTNLHQVAVRDGLYDALTRAFLAAGIPWDECDNEDRGDGVLVMVPPSVAKSAFVETLPSALVAALRKHNERHRAEEQIRLRMALHAGEIHYDGHGVVGRAVNLAFRLLDAAVFKAAMGQSTGLLALITSAWFFEEVVWHSQAANPDTYRQVRVTAKETDTLAWICLPDSDTPPTLRPPPPPRKTPVPQQLPLESRQFVGRERQIAQLAEPMPITTIDGTAGIGKTSLAMYGAHRVKHRFPDGQLHVNLRGFDPREPMDPDQALHGFLQALGADAPGIPAGTEDKAALYRSLLADRRVLVVLDNARSADQVRPLLPGNPACAVIVTSRNRLDSLAVHEGARRIALDSLSAEEATALLAERVGADRIAAEPDATAALLDLCARLPLALSIAAARAASQPDLTISGLVAQLRDQQSRLDVLDLGDDDLSLRAVFSWSYQVLSPAAARLFRLLGMHPGPDIDAFACGALVAPPTGPLHELTSAHLLTEYVAGRYRFHDLLRVYATGLSEDDPERATAGQALLEYYLHAAILADRHIQPVREDCSLSWRTELPLPRIFSYSSAMSWFVAEHATLLAMITFAADRGFATFAWQLAWSCTTFLRRSGRLQERAAVHRTALAATRREGDHEGQLVALRHLANAVARLGRHDEALAYLDEADRVLRAESCGNNAIHNHLAYTRVYEARERPDLALEHARKAWALVQNTDEPLLNADALTALGHQLALLGRHAEALPLCERALELYSAMAHLEGQADVLLTIGDIEHNLGEHVSAVVRYQQSLDLDQRLGDRYWQAMALERLGDVQRDTDGAAAEKALRESLAILRDMNHPDAGRVQAKITTA
jgi:tetratricopeptide (TPR) repeat protein